MTSAADNNDDCSRLRQPSSGSDGERPERGIESSAVTATRPEAMRLADVRARWDLLFYCWRRIIVLAVVSVAGGDAILAVIEGRSSHALDEFVRLLRLL